MLNPARFGLHLAVHLLSRYAHLTATFVTVEQLRWARIGSGSGSNVNAGGSEPVGHKHAFWRDGTEKRFVVVEVARKSDGDDAVARVAGGLRDLLGTLMTRKFPPALPNPLSVVRWRVRFPHACNHQLSLIVSYSAQINGIDI